MYNHELEFACVLLTKKRLTSLQCKTNWSESGVTMTERVSWEPSALRVRPAECSGFASFFSRRRHLRDHRPPARFAWGHTSVRIQIADGAWNVFRVCGGAALSCSPPDFQSKWQDVAFKMKLPVSWKWCGWRNNNIFLGDWNFAWPCIKATGNDIWLQISAPPLTVTIKTTRVMKLQ